MGSWCNGQLVVWAAGGMGIYSDFTMYFLHFDLSEIIAFDTYLPITPALPVTSETCPLPLDYSTRAFSVIANFVLTFVWIFTEHVVNQQRMFKILFTIHNYFGRLWDRPAMWSAWTRRPVLIESAASCSEWSPPPPPAVCRWGCSSPHLRTRTCWRRRWLCGGTSVSQPTPSTRRVVTGLVPPCSWPMMLVPRSTVWG